jgi:vacuolar protein sorting-associated protein 13B
VGALTKPISGAAELLALTGQGVLQSVGYNTLPISRLSILSRESTVEPSNAKLVWNYLPEMFRSESVLFSTIAEMDSINGDNRKPVMLGLLSKVFVIIDLTAETTMEILTLDRVQPSLVASKPNVIVIKVQDSKSCSPNRLADQQITDRVFQYVQQSAMYASR